MDAVAHNCDSRQTNSSMDWTNVRDVYRKLQTDFHLLTEPFGIFVPPERNEDLSQLIGAIDVVDRELDRIPSAQSREAFMTAVLKFLMNQSKALPDDAAGELVVRLTILKEIIFRLGIRDEFCKTIRRIVDHGERKRIATNQTEMIRHLVEEWRLTGVLPVLFLGKLSNPQFEKFFDVCCATMPAIDMLQDACLDFRSGQISVRPDLMLYFRLIAVFCMPLPKLLFLFPKPTILIRYAISFIWQGIRGESNQ